MEFSESRDINASAKEVWDAILNPDILKSALPGTKELTGNVEDGFEAIVQQKVGPVKATFKGAVTVSDLDPPRSLRLDGQGKGGVAGFAKGGADVRLEETENGTILHYSVDAKVGGKLAQLGSRIIAGFSKKLADQFFSNLISAIERPGEDEEGAASV